MNKADLIKSIEQTLGSRKAATEALDAVLDAIVREVSKGGKVAITGFGTFEKAARAARTGRNPQTGEPVRIPETSVPRFKAATSFKSYVANPATLPLAAPAVARAAAGTVAQVVDTAAKVAGISPQRSSSPQAATETPSTGKKTSTATRSAATKSAAKKSSAKKSSAKKASSTAKKTSTPKKTSAAKKTSSPATKTTAKKSTAKKSTS